MPTTDTVHPVHILANYLSRYIILPSIPELPKILLLMKISNQNFVCISCLAPWTLSLQPLWYNYPKNKVESRNHKTHTYFLSSWLSLLNLNIYKSLTQNKYCKIFNENRINIYFILINYKLPLQAPHHVLWMISIRGLLLFFASSRPLSRLNQLYCSPKPVTHRYNLP